MQGKGFEPSKLYSTGCLRLAFLLEKEKRKAPQKKNILICKSNSFLWRGAIAPFFGKKGARHLSPAHLTRRWNPCVNMKLTGRFL
jgi:hypothetical protein